MALTHVTDFTGASIGPKNIFANNATTAQSIPVTVTPNGGELTFSTGQMLALADLSNTKFPVISGTFASIKMDITLKSEIGTGSSRTGFGLLNGSDGVVCFYNPGTGTANHNWSARRIHITTPSTDTTRGVFDFITPDIKGYSPIANAAPAIGEKVTVFMSIDTVTKHVKITANGTIFFDSAVPALTSTSDFKPVLIGGFSDVVLSNVEYSDSPAAPAPEGTISVSPSIPAHTSGEAVSLATLFVVPSNIIGDLDITLNPTNAGSYNTTTHVITLSSSFTGSLSVTATAKAGVIITGSPATATFQVNAAVVQPPSGGSEPYPWPNGLNTLNYPVKTDLQKKFWVSKHVCNHTKAIIAFSLTIKNANDNLRRYGYTRGWRTKSLYHYGKYVNHYEMTGIPFTEMETPWYKEMGFVEGITIDSVLAGHVAP